jgi:hypothetical protein
MILGEPKWLWFLQTEPVPPPNSGKADSIEEAEAAFKRRYAEVKDDVTDVSNARLRMASAHLSSLPDTSDS